ncbi:chromatin modification-related protein EAF7-domain-containing protein [Xylaria nigripes]|nr:chromatin modification-related protein EAF7-domain-containing protein [Xylaria nigripes]
MAPKRKSKSLLEAVTPKTSGTSTQEEDAMDVDTPKASETPRAVDTPALIKANLPSEAEILGDLWTEDQTSSLFKAIIRWKPSGMHKHFRMIAISEHLRNHGFDPSIETHTRIPGIWLKLRQFFDMDMIDERDNSFDYVKSLGGDQAPEELYKDFELLPDEFHDLMWGRAAANENEPDNWTESEAEDENASAAKKQQMRKRRRGDTDAGSTAGSAVAKMRRASTADDTDMDASSPVNRGNRRPRSRKRTGTKTKAGSVESDDEDEEDDEEEESDDTSEEEEEEAEVPAARSSRGGRGRGRGRGRVKGGRKKT